VLRRFGWPAGTPLALSPAEDLPSLVEAAAAFAATFDPAVVVTDHYGVGLAEEMALARAPRRVAVIDDLADRRHLASLLVDPGFGRRASDYDGLTLAGAEVLAGPLYALVRQEFAAARPRALSRRAKHGAVRRALVSLGLTDVGGITARVVETLAPELGEARLEVVVGAEAPSLERLRAIAAADGRIRVHVDTTDMASLCADADVAIGAGGSSVWERATVALPTATVVLAQNQSAMVEALARTGLTVALDARADGFEAALVQTWRGLVDEDETRRALGERAAEICDGRGAERVADAILALA
jgi:UDP-2,4-diacetamido-2,4,6-trideoxy-beta-L-altropyranose hydrolase